MKWTRFSKVLWTDWSGELIGMIIVSSFFGSVTIMIFQGERLKMVGWSLLACAFIIFMIWMGTVIVLLKREVDK